MRMLVLALLALGVLAFGGCGAGENSPGGPDTPVSDRDPVPSGVQSGRGALTGRVLAADGKPVAGALVTPVGIGDAPPVPEIAVSTGADGTYRWPLGPGTYRITVTPSGASPVDGGTVTLAPGGSATLDVRLP